MTESNDMQVYFVLTEYAETTACTQRKIIPRSTTQLNDITVDIEYQGCCDFTIKNRPSSVHLDPNPRSVLLCRSPWNNIAPPECGS